MFKYVIFIIMFLTAARVVLFHDLNEIATLIMVCYLNPFLKEKNDD